MKDQVQMLPDGRAFVSDKDIAHWPLDMRNWIRKCPLFYYDYRLLGYVTKESTRVSGTRREASQRLRWR